MAKTGYRGGYKGAQWAKIVRGKCSVHGVPVGRFSKLCYRCHRQQMQEAGHA